VSETPLYPDITVRLSGKNGNAMSIIGAVRRALRRGQVPVAEINDFSAEAMAGDYDHVLRTCMRWVSVS